MAPSASTRYAYDQKFKRMTMLKKERDETYEKLLFAAEFVDLCQRAVSESEGITKSVAMMPETPDSEDLIANLNRSQENYKQMLVDALKSYDEAMEKMYSIRNKMKKS